MKFNEIPSSSKMLSRPFSDACVFAKVTPRHLTKKNVDLQDLDLIPNIYLVVAIYDKKMLSLICQEAQNLKGKQKCSHFHCVI